ncbi:MAG: response regulator transcription factor [Rhodocyclaceae bacterium]|nr:response regulator transcription factor [Rhodocyclaceae bacterium]
MNAAPEPTVFVVDDDAGVRRSMRMLMEAAGHPVACFDSAEAFLHAWRPDWHGCLVLDVRMNGMSGSALHEILTARGIPLPVIYLTAYADVPWTVQAMRRGAVDVLVKPAQGHVLLAEVERILADHCKSPPSTASDGIALDGLTPRQTEIIRLAVGGASNKEIARRLGISHRTVEYHRTQILNKTGAASFLQIAASLPGAAETSGKASAGESAGPSDWSV